MASSCVFPSQSPGQSLVVWVGTPFPLSLGLINQAGPPPPPRPGCCFGNCRRSSRKTGLSKPTPAHPGHPRPGLLLGVRRKLCKAVSRASAKGGVDQSVSGSQALPRLNHWQPAGERDSLKVARERLKSEKDPPENSALWPHFAVYWIAWGLWEVLVE